MDVTRWKNFQISQFEKKDNSKHTIHLIGGTEYYSIPIFQKNDSIKSSNQSYTIIKLKRRTETYIQYKVQDLNGTQISIKYLYIFDDQQNDENYIYYNNQQINDQKVFRLQGRIAIEDKNKFIKLTRFIHLNNLNQITKIKLLHTFADDNQLEQQDYNQIYVHNKDQIERIKTNLNQISCFVQAPTSISPIINYQQTFLIGFYYALLNNLVIFNQYIIRENNIKQALQIGSIDSQFQLLQQIKGTINYQYKLQIPKKLLLQGIQKTLLDDKLNIQQQIKNINFEDMIDDYESTDDHDQKLSDRYIQTINQNDANVEIKKYQAEQSKEIDKTIIMLQAKIIKQGFSDFYIYINNSNAINFRYVLILQIKIYLEWMVMPGFILILLKIKKRLFFISNRERMHIVETYLICINWV